MKHIKSIIILFLVLSTIQLFAEKHKFENNYITGCAPAELCGSLQITPKNNNQKITLVSYKISTAPIEPEMFQRSGSLAFAWSDDPLRYSIPESDEEKLKRIQLLYIQKAQYRYRKLGEYTFNDAKSQSFIYGDCFLKKQIYCYIDDPVNPTVKKNVPCHEVVDIKTLSHKRPCIGIAKPQGLKNLNLTNPF